MYPSTLVREVNEVNMRHHEGTSARERVGVSAGEPVRVGVVGRGRFLRHNSPNSSEKSGVAGVGNASEGEGMKGFGGVQSMTTGGPGVGVGASGRAPSPEWGNWEDTCVGYDEMMMLSDHSGTAGGGGGGGGAGAGASVTPRGYRRRLDLSAIKMFIGISGPYNLQVRATSVLTTLSLLYSYPILILI